MARSAVTATSEQLRRPFDAGATSVGRAGSRACGNAVEVRLTLAGEGDKISELRVVTRGHQLPGDPSALETLFVGMNIAQALAVTHREIAIRLGGLPESQMYCSVLLHEALRSAVAAARGQAQSERVRPPCVTCRCFSVAEDLIRRAVRVNALTSVEQVACYTRAGSGCGLCADGISSILSSVRRERYQGSNPTYAGPPNISPANDE